MIDSIRPYLKDGLLESPAYQVLTIFLLLVGIINGAIALMRVCRWLRKPSVSPQVQKLLSLMDNPDGWRLEPKDHDLWSKQVYHEAKDIRVDVGIEGTERGKMDACVNKSYVSNAFSRQENKAVKKQYWRLLNALKEDRRKSVLSVLDRI